MYCPSWIFNAASARSAYEFLSSEMPLEACAKKYAVGLSESYSEIQPELILVAATPCLEFLSELEAGERAAEFLNDYVYNEIYFEKVNVPRKMKPLFGSVEDPVKTVLYAPENVLVSFRAFVYRMRSGTDASAPAGWSPATDQNIPIFADITGRQMSVLDVL